MNWSILTHSILSSKLINFSNPTTGLPGKSVVKLSNGNTFETCNIVQDKLRLFLECYHLTMTKILFKTTCSRCMRFKLLNFQNNFEELLITNLQDFKSRPIVNVKILFGGNLNVPKFSKLKKLSCDV